MAIVRSSFRLQAAALSIEQWAKQSVSTMNLIHFLDMRVNPETV
jgi:hypothetical protein